MRQIFESCFLFALKLFNRLVLAYQDFMRLVAELKTALIFLTPELEDPLM